jgi:hypothetical protein
LQEADTTSEWTKATVAKFLSIRTLPSKSSTTGIVLAVPASPEIRAPSHAAAPVDRAIAEQIERTAGEFVDELSDGDMKSLLSYWTSQRGIPPEFDGRLLARCRSTLERDLDTVEKKFARAEFTDAVRNKADIVTSDSQ